MPKYDWPAPAATIKLSYGVRVVPSGLTEVARLSAKMVIAGGETLVVYRTPWTRPGRLRAGTYSSQTAGGSTTWLSQLNTGKSLRVLVAVIGMK